MDPRIKFHKFPRAGNNSVFVHEFLNCLVEHGTIRLFARGPPEQQEVNGRLRKARRTRETARRNSAYTWRGATNTCSVVNTAWRSGLYPPLAHKVRNVCAHAGAARTMNMHVSCALHQTPASARTRARDRARARRFIHPARLYELYMRSSRRLMAQACKRTHPGITHAAGALVLGF